MRNFPLILLISLTFFSACGQTLKNTWGDFRAYYNTYYNAKESYRAGLAKVREQPFTIEPGELVRIHHAPVQAGNSDFQKAIDKGAKILRKFPDTKWVDDAILLIGKSYYYRHEFYPAQQKFEELRDVGTSPEMEQLAIIWKGRTLLDLELNAEGVTYLETELEEYSGNWSPARKAEIQTLIAQHHAMLENWEEAAAFISDALADLEDKQLLARTYFLYGQVLERLEDYGGAYFAFSRTAELFPGFEYRYWGLFKQADMARKQQNLDLAIRIYEGLSRDDKYIARRGELAFEIARTLEMKGEVAEAEKRYKKLLYGSQDRNTQHLRADIYYRLGKIYSDEYEKLSIAAAYYDSSSTSSNLVLTVDENQDPETLADAFGEYKRLRNDINRTDSLLRLGTLPADELEAELERIRDQKRRELREQQQAEAESEQLANVSNIAGADSPNSTSSSRYGFLNYRNMNRVNQSKAKFRAVWGRRPLVDNWRRVRTVRRSSSTGIKNKNVGQEIAAVTLDLEAIPENPEERRKLNAEKVNKQYELGNLLFFELDSPDEAKEYFHKVIHSQSSSDLRSRAMYSLYEIYKTSGNRDSLQYWRNQLLQEYPDTEYARRMQNTDSAPPADSKQNSTDTLLQQYRQIEYASTFGYGKRSKAAALRKLALENRDSELAPHIHYKAIEAYINQAKAYEKIADSLGSEMLIGTQNTSEASGETAVFTNDELQFSLDGVYWDSVRTVAHEFDTTFTDIEQQTKVAGLLEILDQESQIPTCDETGIYLSIKGGMDSFLSTVNYPENVREMSVSGQVVYSFVVIPTGEVKSFELVSQPSSLGIEEAFEQAFKQNMRFEPLKIEDPPPAIRCEVTFPIDH